MIQRVKIVPVQSENKEQNSPQLISIQDEEGRTISTEKDIITALGIASGLLEGETGQFADESSIEIHPSLIEKLLVNSDTLVYRQSKFQTGRQSGLTNPKSNYSLAPAN